MINALSDVFDESHIEMHEDVTAGEWTKTEPMHHFTLQYERSVLDGTTTRRHVDKRDDGELDEPSQCFFEEISLVVVLQNRDMSRRGEDQDAHRLH